MYTCILLYSVCCVNVFSEFIINITLLAIYSTHYFLPIVLHHLGVAQRCMYLCVTAVHECMWMEKESCKCGSSMWRNWRTGRMTGIVRYPVKEERHLPVAYSEEVDRASVGNW